VSALHQVNLQYDRLEDRALLRLSTVARAEFRFWLTRRFVRALWPALLGALEAQGPGPADPSARGAVLSFRHEAALGQGDFATPYQPDAIEFPLGEAPLLLGQASLKSGPDGRPILCLLPAGGRGIEVALGPVLLHSLCQLLRDVAEKADWDLGLAVAPAPRPPSASRH